MGYELKWVLWWAWFILSDDWNEKPCSSRFCSWAMISRFLCICKRLLNHFRNKSSSAISKVNILKKTNFYWGNLVSCRINRLLIFYLNLQAISTWSFKKRSSYLFVKFFCLLGVFSGSPHSLRGILYSCTHVVFRVSNLAVSSLQSVRNRLLLTKDPTHSQHLCLRWWCLCLD